MHLPMGKIRRKWLNNCAMPYLLQTKTRIPPLRAQHASRLRLVDKLTARADARLLLVSAPAGFGKSSCLVEWAHSLLRDGVRVAWYELDAQDNDPVRFAAYLINAFQVADERFDVPLPSNQPLDLQEAIALILNEAARQTEPYRLVLDDYHLITAPAIHDAISRMCDFLPENLSIAIGTRADPPFQLARLRARGAIVEVRMSDLRFSAGELTGWLQAALGWSPSARLIEQLDGLTEGWAAALALIIMSLNAQPTPDEQALEAQLGRYSQTQRYIYDFFAQEILERQSAEVREFLLDTCVLNRMHPALCSAITGSDRAPLLLGKIAAESLFVIPLSEAEPIYRYHHLFEQFLREHLQLKNRARYVDLHRQAAEWYAAHDSITEAVRHALAAEDFAYAAALIEDSAWKLLTSRGEIMTVIHWLPAFSEDVLRRYPRLCLYFSRALYLTGDIEPSDRYVRLAAETLEQDDETPERQALRAIALNYQATLAAYRGEIADGLTLNVWAFNLGSQSDALDQARIANTGAYLQYLRGDVEAARTAYEHALERARRLDHHYLMLDAQYYLAQVDLIAGRLGAAKARCEAILAQYPTPIAPLSAIMLPLARVRYEQNRLVDAKALIRNAIGLAQRGNIPDTLWFALLLMANTQLARDQHADARLCIRQARQICERFRSPVMLSLVGAVEARWALQTDRLDDAVAWAEQYAQQPAPEYRHDVEDLTLARVWLAREQPTEALALLAQVVAAAQAAGRTEAVIEAEMLQALTFSAAGQQAQALDRLAAAVTLGAPEGYTRLFLDAGKPMLSLLRRGVDSRALPAYAELLLDAARQPDAAHPADALTEREIEVLQQLAAGASNQDIADALVISLGTVKSHIHHVMNKLGAQNRTDAVARARSLNILKN
ncbi:MAG: hypothetical protein IT319_12860 [Anaerolineae bacterium]|nr:hypothetical protein [Anaerolineae bacterium]